MNKLYCDHCEVEIVDYSANTRVELIVRPRYPADHAHQTFDLCPSCTEAVTAKVRAAVYR